MGNSHECGKNAAVRQRCFWSSRNAEASTREGDTHVKLRRTSSRIVPVWDSAPFLSFFSTCAATSTAVACERLTQPERTPPGVVALVHDAPNPLESFTLSLIHLRPTRRIRYRSLIPRQLANERCFWSERTPPGDVSLIHQMSPLLESLTVSLIHLRPTKRIRYRPWVLHLTYSSDEGPLNMGRQHRNTSPSLVRHLAPLLSRTASLPRARRDGRDGITDS